MKTYLKFLVLLLWVGLDVACKQTNAVQPLTAGCRKIVISEDGDETEYEFDGQGLLLSIFGQSLAAFNANNAALKLNWRGPDGEQIGLQKVSTGWSYSLFDAANQSGFDNLYTVAPGNQSGRISQYLSELFDAGDPATEVSEVYEYNASGDCSAIKSGYVDVDNQRAISYTALFSYITNRPAPFAGSPFQWLIEQGWSAGGHTNQHLTKDAQYTIQKTDDPEVSAIIDRTVRYAYSFDGQNRLSRIQINSEEKITVTKRADGTTTTNTVKDQKIVTFAYDC
jgi:hypothetical protein